MLEQATTREPTFKRGETLVGLAGTVSALASIEQGLESYDRDRLHHHTLTEESVEDLLESLAAASTAKRRLRPGMEYERADVIVGGAIVLAEVMHHFGFGGCLTSEADILDGLVLSLASG
jgi:exopolyphosphatase/guanosine-5'-triphosphate,3'-diphosphate pyrophosphatase